MLHAPHIVFLQSETGARAIAEAETLSGDLLTRLTRLRRHFSPEQAAAAIQLLDLRRRARARFARADQMLFTPDGLEQATGETIAAYRAARFSADARVLDLCCGIGGDTIALARRGPVAAFDRSEAAVLCARANAEVYEVGERARFACADVTALRWRADAAFFDPARRAEGRRLRDADAYLPPLSFAETLRRHVPNLAVKVSPALDDATLARYPASVEFLSDRGECKEGLLWFGALDDGARRRATLLPAGETLTARDAPRPPVSEPLAYLYEPDPAVIRAGLIAELADDLGLALLDPQIAYLTAAALIPTPFAAAYRVFDWLPFSLKQVNARLRAAGCRVEAIKRRGVPLEPEALRKTLTGGGPTPAVVVLTRVHARPAALLCLRAGE